MTKHNWKERTEDGDVRLLRASKHGDNWVFQSKLKSEEYWTTHDPIPLADLESLLDLLRRKYQRRRVPFEHVQQIEELIADHGGV